VVLSIDIQLQKMVEDLFGTRRGALVALDPNTGEVLAFVSKPTFDPNLFVDGIDSESWKMLSESIDKPLLNRALRGTYPPGSTYKPFMALAALETGKRSASEVINDTTGNRRIIPIHIKSIDFPKYKAIDKTELFMELYWKWRETGDSWMLTKQEIKDEMKDMEGRPEIKAQIRRRQREMSSARMMDSVKNADVVITNPEHFAVALAYDPNGDSAPILLAKGADAVAARIREEATKHGVYLFEAPLLARALYFTTKLDHPIPEALYHAVAQVIAFVFSLNQSYGRGQEVIKPDPKIPDEMKFDANGVLMNS
jgi:type III secretion system FlhB-like substrate exporter